MAKAIDRTAFDILEAERNAVRAAFTTASDAAADFGELEQRASKRGVPVGELVREILERALRQRAGDLLSRRNRLAAPIRIDTAIAQVLDFPARSRRAPLAPSRQRAKACASSLRAVYCAAPRRSSRSTTAHRSER